MAGVVDVYFMSKSLSVETILSAVFTDQEYLGLNVLVSLPWRVLMCISAVCY